MTSGKKAARTRQRQWDQMTAGQKSWKTKQRKAARRDAVKGVAIVGLRSCRTDPTIGRRSPK